MAGLAGTRVVRTTEAEAEWRMADEVGTVRYGTAREAGVAWRDGWARR